METPDEAPVNALMRGEQSAFVRALGFISDSPEDSLDLGPDDDQDDDTAKPAVICPVCKEEESEDGVCACRCRGCGQPDKSGWCDACDEGEPRE